MIDVATATIDTFRPLVGQSFELESDGAILKLRLAEAVPAGTGQREGGAFSLVFVAPPDSDIEQGVFSLSHPSANFQTFFFLSRQTLT